MTNRGCRPRSIRTTERPSRRAIIASSEPAKPEPRMAISKLGDTREIQNSKLKIQGKFKAQISNPETQRTPDRRFMNSFYLQLDAHWDHEPRDAPSPDLRAPSSPLRWRGAVMQISGRRFMESSSLNVWAL